MISAMLNAICLPMWLASALGMLAFGYEPPRDMVIAAFLLSAIMSGEGVWRGLERSERGCP